MRPINNTNRTYVTRNFSNFDAEENITPIDEDVLDSIKGKAEDFIKGKANEFIKDKVTVENAEKAIRAAGDFLAGKARLYGDVQKALTSAGTIFSNAAKEYPDLKGAADKAQAEIDKIKKDIGEIPQDKKRSEYRDALEGIEKSKSDFAIELGKYLEKNKDYVEVAKIIGEAAKMSEEAAKKAIDVDIKISKIKEEEKNTKDIKLKDALKLSKTIKKDEVKGKNEEIHDVQKEFIRKFKNNSKIKDSEIYKKIKDAVEAKKQGGFFGPTTEKIIKGLKAGFGMDDKTSDITQDLINKIYTEKIEESNRAIKGFSNFDLMNEDFDAAKFLEVVGGKSDENKDKVKVSVDNIKKEMKKASDKSYEENKEGIDYMMGKSFTPSNDGKDLFQSLFNKSWDDFTKLDDDKKKEFLSVNFKNSDSLQPADKTKIDLFFKKYSTPKVR